MPEQWEVCVNGFKSEEEASTFIDVAFAAFTEHRLLAAMIYPLDSNPETR